MTAVPSQWPPALILKPRNAGAESGLHANLTDVVDVDGLYHDEVPVPTVAGRRRGAEKAGEARVIR